MDTAPQAATNNSKVEQCCTQSLLMCFMCRHMTVRVHTGKEVTIQRFSRSDSADAQAQMTITVEKGPIGAAAMVRQHHLLCMSTSLQVRSFPTASALFRCENECGTYLSSEATHQVLKLAVYLH